MSNYQGSNREIDQMLTLEGRYFRPKLASEEMSRSIQSRIDEIFSSERLDRKSVIPSRVGTEASGKLFSLQTSADHLKSQEKLSGQFEEDDAAAHHGFIFAESDGWLPAEYPSSLFGEYVESSLRTGWDVSNIFSAIEYLRFMPGEKHLLFFSRVGLFLPDAESEKMIGRIACDGRVRVHSIHTGGVVEAPAIDFDLAADRDHFPERNDGWTRSLGFRRESKTFAQRALPNISELSGGRGYLMTDTSEALGKIDRMTRLVYRLAYQPDSEQSFGKFRKRSAEDRGNDKRNSFPSLSVDRWKVSRRVLGRRGSSLAREHSNSGAFSKDRNLPG